MRDSEEGKSFVGMLKDKRIQLGIALFLLVVWNFWVLYQWGYVSDAVILVLALVSPIVVSFINFVNYLAEVLKFVSIFVGVSFGTVADLVVSKNLYDSENKARVLFVVPTFLLFGLFMLPIWSLYNDFNFWSGLGGYVVAWLVGALVLLANNRKLLKKIYFSDLAISILGTTLLFWIFFGIVLSLEVWILGILILLVFIGFIVVLDDAYDKHQNCDGCDVESERFRTKEEVAENIIAEGWKKNNSYGFREVYCPVCVAKREKTRKWKRETEVHKMKDMSEII